MSTKRSQKGTLEEIFQNLSLLPIVIRLNDFLLHANRWSQRKNSNEIFATFHQSDNLSVPSCIYVSPLTDYLLYLLIPQFSAITYEYFDITTPKSIHQNICVCNTILATEYRGNNWFSLWKSFSKAKISRSESHIHTDTHIYRHAKCLFRNHFSPR